MTKLRSTHSERFLAAISSCERALIVGHDNPDPDCIAGGWALHVLIKRRLRIPARLVSGGEIVRAENRHLMDLLEPPLELVREMEVGPREAVILIDCGYGAENNLLARSSVRPVAVIDHHPPLGPTHRLPFKDIRPSAAAASSIAASYLREQGMEPGERLATALVYAIRTETRGAESDHSRLDRSIVRWLSAHADPTKLAAIESAPLARGYFGDLVMALQDARLYGDTALCLLPRATGPEIVGEVADLLIRCADVRRVLCGALVDGDLVISVRTARGGENAAVLLRRTLEGLSGGGGGHKHRAGGKIPSVAPTGRIEPALERDLVRRWLAACDSTVTRGVRLVAGATREPK